ncbi:hypothetical protein HMI55_000969 [Coelomomyces lativittatus]|nr:hypothetical protein HMI55_000969 [Coelomomyces lativittatus]
MYGAEALRGGAQPQSRSGRHANHPFHHGFDHASFETPPFPFFGTRSSFHFRNPEEIFREFFGDVHSHFDQMFTGMHPMHPPMPMFPGFPSPGFSSSSSSSTFHSSRGVHPIQSFLSSSSSSSLGPSSSFSTSHEVTTTYVNGQKRIHTKTRDAQGNVSEEIITVGPDGHQHVQRIGSSTSQPPQGLPFAHGHPSGGHRMNSSNSVSMSNTSTHPHSHSHWQHHR